MSQTLWTRTAPFDPQSIQQETWHYDDGQSSSVHTLDVHLSKPLNVLGLKKDVLSHYQKQVQNISQSRKDLFSGDLEQIEHCPICKTSSTRSKAFGQIYGAEYVRCSKCSHAYVLKRPKPQALDAFYAQSASYQSTYADKATALQRVKEIALPKAQWAIERFEKLHGRKPKTILDVGAGSGHFVKACQDLGIAAQGIEPSESGRAFCQDNFEITLLDEDFLETYQTHQEFELISFWGVIEHVPQPLAMLESASKLLEAKDCGLLVVEVPKIDCLGSHVQNLFPQSIVRHLDPLGHIHCFSESSLATAFVQSDFKLNAAWYFGMDIYELFCQLSFFQNNSSLLEHSAEWISSLQKQLDHSRWVDTIVFAGTKDCSP